MESSKNLVVIGSCSVDFTAYAARLPLAGETIHGKSFRTSYGGKGANQCVAAQKLGAKTTFIARVGDDSWGAKYRNYLYGLGIDVSHILETPNNVTGIAQITVADGGENQIVIVTGANNQLSVKDVDTASNTIANASVLVGQLETPLETTLEAFKICTGIKILNAAPAVGNLDEILLYTTILCVNESEASELTGKNVTDARSAILALNELLEKGCEIVIVTLGKNGAVYAKKTDKLAIHVPCDVVTSVDATGAGDAFIGALAMSLCQERVGEFHQMVGAACKVASYSVTLPGTQESYPSGDIGLWNNRYTFNVIN